MANKEPVLFRCVATTDFDVVPIQVGKVYNVTDISADGTRWEALDEDGISGWFPSAMCTPAKKTGKKANYQMAERKKIVGKGKANVDVDRAHARKIGKVQGSVPLAKK